MIYTEALSKERKDSLIFLKDKNKGWVVWGKRFGNFPRIFQGRELKNPKTISILKKRNDWSLLEITDDMLNKSRQKKNIDLSKYIQTEEKIISCCSDVW